MTVKELITILKDLPQDASVYLEDQEFVLESAESVSTLECCDSQGNVGDGVIIGLFHDDDLVWAWQHATLIPA